MLISIRGPVRPAARFGGHPHDGLYNVAAEILPNEPPHTAKPPQPHPNCLFTIGSLTKKLKMSITNHKELKMQIMSHENKYRYHIYNIYIHAT